MLRENLKDSAEILQNILNQPLEISEEENVVSLIQAVKNFSSQHPEDSDLKKTLHSFTLNREPSEILIQELQLIAEDLTVKNQTP